MGTFSTIVSNAFSGNQNIANFKQPSRSPVQDFVSSIRDHSPWGSVVV